MPPYFARSAYRHTHKANTPAKKKLWAKVANRNAGKGESRAIRIANFVVKKGKRR